MSSMGSKKKPTAADGSEKEQSESELENIAYRLMEAVRKDNAMQFQSSLKRFIKLIVEEESDEKSEHMEY